jgi:hypothetical protein
MKFSRAGSEANGLTFPVYLGSNAAFSEKAPLDEQFVAHCKQDWKINFNKKHKKI